MLMNCPKCGFSQPQDRYCASCGIDMQAFKPSVEPFASRVARGMGAQILVLILVFGGATAYFIKSKDNAFPTDGSSAVSKRRTSAAPGAVQTATSSSTPEPSSAAPQMADSNPNTGAAASALGEKGAPTIPGAMSPPAVDGTNEVAAGFAEGTSPNPAAPAAEGEAGRVTLALNTPVQVEIIWAEVREDYMERLVKESPARNPVQDYGTYKTGVVADPAKIFAASNSNIKVLLKEKKTLFLTKSQQWFLGKRGATTEQDLGFDVYLELVDGDGAYRGNLQLTRAWKPAEEPATAAPEVRTPANERASFPANYELHLNEAFFVTGFLPRTQGSVPTDATFMAISPFEILKSSEFQNSQADLVAFLTFDKK